MTPLTLVANLATRWHHLHTLQIWPQDDTTCISIKIGHQMAPLASVYITCIASLPWIALLALSASIELVSSSARVTSVKSNQTLLTHSLTYWQPDPTIGPQVYLGPIKMGGEVIHLFRSAVGRVERDQLKYSKIRTKDKFVDQFNYWLIDSCFELLSPKLWSIELWYQLIVICFSHFTTKIYG